MLPKAGRGRCWFEQRWRAQSGKVQRKARAGPQGLEAWESSVSSASEKELRTLRNSDSLPTSGVVSKVAF